MAQKAHQDTIDQIEGNPFSLIPAGFAQKMDAFYEMRFWIFERLPLRALLLAILLLVGFVLGGVLWGGAPTAQEPQISVNFFSYVPAYFFARAMLLLPEMFFEYKEKQVTGVSATSSLQP